MAAATVAVVTFMKAALGLLSSFGLLVKPMIFFELAVAVLRCHALPEGTVLESMIHRVQRRLFVTPLSWWSTPTASCRTLFVFLL